jgi:hypothetical protein
LQLTTQQEEQMNRKGSLIKGTVLAVMLGTGITATVANAASLEDQQLQTNLAAESFRLDWNAQPNGDGQTRITGYVYSDKGHAADDVQLRIAEVDASGQTVATYFPTMMEEVPSKGRAYFDVKVPRNSDATTYQVGVYSWNTIEGATK